MFLRRKKVQPSVDEYILRRYDDTAVRIHADLHSERGLHNYYALWLEGMLEGFPEEQRKKYSLVRVTSGHVFSAWTEEAGTSTHTTETKEEGGLHTELYRGPNAVESLEGRREERSGRDGALRSHGDHEKGVEHTERTKEIGDATHSKFCAIL